MDKTVADAIRAHAQGAVPAEACGVVIDGQHGPRYVPCRNIGGDTAECFVLHPEDLAAAEDACIGSLLAVVHSHPFDPPEPSDADLAQCNESYLPWIIAGRDLDGEDPGAWVLRTIYPDDDGEAHPAECNQLLGRPFVHGFYDCYALLRDWMRIEHGIEIPDFERRQDWWLRGEDLIAQRLAEAGYVVVQSAQPGPIDPGRLRYGDVVLTRHGGPVINHIGVILHGGYLLHHAGGQLSRRELYTAAWQRITRLVVRHKDML